jgi:hypothetical protein
VPARLATGVRRSTLSLRPCAAHRRGSHAHPPGPGTDSLTLDFATVVYRLQLLGFNAVRLPFSFADLYDTPPKSQTRSCPQARAPLVPARCAEAHVRRRAS